MKYAIVIPDGASDEPIEELEGQTPLEVAVTPNLDALARAGRVGTCVTTPPGFEAGSDICSMALLGYDPLTYHTGRAPLEAASLGLSPGPSEWVFRVNLVTVSEDADDPGEGLMLDHSAGGIPSAEARRVVEDLFAHWSREAPELAGSLSLTPGVSYRNILIDSSGDGYDEVDTVPPHQIPGSPWVEHLPDGGPSAEKLCRLIGMSHEFLREHPVNAARREQGLRPANMAWIWGQGTATRLPSFESRFGLRGAMTTAVDLLGGIARLMGWDVLDVPGATSYHDNDYAGQGRAAVGALDRYDVVCCHVEAPDECSHQGDFQTKIAAIEAIDAHVIGPIAEKLKSFGDAETDASAAGWRLLVLPDHATLCSTRRHDDTPVPFMMSGAWVRSVVQRRLTEAEAAESDVHVDPGCDLMEYFLRGGRKDAGR